MGVIGVVANQAFRRGVAERPSDTIGHDLGSDRRPVCIVEIFRILEIVAAASRLDIHGEARRVVLGVSIETQQAHPRIRCREIEGKQAANILHIVQQGFVERAFVDFQRIGVQGVGFRPQRNEVDADLGEDAEIAADTCDTRTNDGAELGIRLFERFARKQDAALNRLFVALVDLDQGYRLR